MAKSVKVTYFGVNIAGVRVQGIVKFGNSVRDC